ncbi:MAG: SGNH/GDSL hydrolase family protein [Solirubrobacterales bacterium]
MARDIQSELFDAAFRRGFDDRAAERLRDDVARADGMGMRDRVFAKVGDSNLALYNALYGLGFLDPVWAGHEALEPTMLRYREVELPAGDPPAAQPMPGGVASNSFSRPSAATRSMIKPEHLMEPASYFAEQPLGWLPDSRCPPDESMLRFEIELLKPRFVLLNVGSNGAKYGLSGRRTGKQVGRIIKEIRMLGPVPIVFTLPPQIDRDEIQGRWKFVEEANRTIKAAARKAKVPVFDQWSALTDESLAFNGLVEFDTGYFDGLHLETLGGFREPDSLEKSVDFSPEGLRYGSNLRNLMVLQVLKLLDSVIDGPAGAARSR